MRMGRDGSPCRGSGAWRSADSNRLTAGVQNRMIGIHLCKRIGTLVTTNIRRSARPALSGRPGAVTRQGSGVFRECRFCANRGRGGGGFGGGGMVAPAFGDVQVADALEGRDDGGADGGQGGGPLLLGETAGARAAQVAADARLEETGVLRRTIESDPVALARARCAERSDGLDGSQARLWGRLSGVVDEYLREDRPR